MSFPMEIRFPKTRRTTLNYSNHHLYIAIKSIAQVGVRAASLTMYFGYITDSNQLQIKEVRISGAVLVESAANTYTEIDLESYIDSEFSSKELERGIVPLGMSVNMNNLATASAAGAQTAITVQATVTTQSALIDANNLSLLGSKTQLGWSQAAAGALAGVVIFQWPAPWSR